MGCLFIEQRLKRQQCQISKRCCTPVVGSRIRHTNANIFDMVVANRKRAINVHACRSAKGRDLAIFLEYAFHELKLIRIVGKNFNRGNIELGTGQLFAQLFCPMSYMPERCIKLLFGGYRAKCVKFIHTSEYIVLLENIYWLTTIGEVIAIIKQDLRGLTS